MNQNNHIIIDAQYPAAMDFTEHGIAAVADSSGWAYIDKQGNIIIRPYVYDNGPDYFSEGLARFVKNGKFGFFNEFGRIVIEAQWDFAYPFQDGKAAVCKGCKITTDNEHSSVTGGEWGYIDKKGNIVVPIGSVKADSVLPKPAKIKLF
ncbi:MAG: WG repeat-containing protein [Calditrichaceae bacterium]